MMCLWLPADNDISYKRSCLADGKGVGSEEMAMGDFFKILDPMIEKLYPELILILFPGEFTSLDKMTDDPDSSGFQDPENFTEESIDILDMFKDKETRSYIKCIIIEGEGGLKITDDLFYAFSRMPFEQTVSDIAGDISWGLQWNEILI